MFRPGYNPYRTEQNRTEQNRTEQNRTEQDSCAFFEMSIRLMRP